MKIFNLFLKHVVRSPFVIITSFALLMVILLPIYSLYEDLYQSNYEPRTYQVGVINLDDENKITQNFLNYLENETELTYLDPNDPEAEADALFTETIDYSLTIPQGYGESLMQGQALPLEKSYSKNFVSVNVVDNLLNNYVLNFNIARASLDQPEDEQAMDSMLSQLSQLLDQSVTIRESKLELNVLTYFLGAMFLPFTTYIFILILAQLYSIPMMEGRKKAIAMRESMSSISSQDKLLQYFLASSFIAVVFWLVTMIVAVWMIGWSNLTSQLGLMLLLASFASLIGIQGMCFFIATIVPNKNALSFVQTVASLLIAFGSGVFVPRMFISPIYQTIVSIASPIWLVKTGELLTNTDILDQTVMGQYWQYLGIMVLIGVAYYALSFFLFKYRSVSQNY